MNTPSTERLETMHAHPMITETDFEQRFDNYADILRWRAANQPNKHCYTFLTNGEKEADHYTYRSLDSRVRALSSRLMSLGAIDQRVLIVLPSDLNFTTTFLACLYSKATAVTSVPPTTEEQLRRLNRIATDADARFVVATQSVIDRVKDQLKDCPALQNAIWIAPEQVSPSEGDSWVDPMPNWDDLALLQYTSGSTSDPKGVMISHRNLARIGRAHEKTFGVQSEDIGVSWIPQSHDMGLIFGVLQPLYTGFPTYLMTPMSFLKKPMRWLHAISRYRASVSIAPNFAYDMCSECVKSSDFEDLDLSTFTLAANGAEPIRKATYDRFLATFESTGFRREYFSSAYGMAETTLAVSVGRRELSFRSRPVDIDMLERGIVLDAVQSGRTRDLISCGKIAPGVNIAIVNPRSLSTLPQDHVGEILISGDIVGLGYWQNLQATESTFQVFTEDGQGPFLRTGDLGFIDQNQELYISGRAKDVIIIQGKNHSPQDIELTVEASHEAVRPRQVAAFSVDHDGSEVVVIIAEISKTHAPDTDPEALGQFLARRVAAEHLVPVLDVVFVKRGQCPKTTSGKIQRQRSRQLYESQEFNVVGSYRNPLFTA